MDVTDKMVIAAGKAIYERHIKEKKLDPEVDKNRSDREWWLKEFQKDARTALEAALGS